MENKKIGKPIRKKTVKKKPVEKPDVKIEKKLDIGRVLRGRMGFATYTKHPKRKEYLGDLKLAKWGVFPSTIVDQALFTGDDEFRCRAQLFAKTEEEALEMQTAAILQASLGIQWGGWHFWLHAANHGILRIPGLYKTEINLAFKVKILSEEVKEDGKKNDKDESIWSYQC